MAFALVCSVLYCLQKRAACRALARLGALSVSLTSPRMSEAKKIFIIDDEESFLDIFSRFLKREGFVVFTFSKQQDALLQAPEQKPDLVLLDVNMPGMNGIEVFKYLKRDDVGLHPRIFFLTSMTQDISGRELDDAYAQSIGADGYINKGEELTVIIEKIKKALAAA